MPIIAIAPRVVLDAIDGRSPTVRLSAATAAKQTRRHPGLARGDYAKVQLILDEGELFRKRAREMNGFVEADGRLWRAAVKTTRNGARDLSYDLPHGEAPRPRSRRERRIWRRIDRERGSDRRRAGRHPRARPKA